MNYPATDSMTAQAVSRTLGVAYNARMQDWPLEVADGDRLAEFLLHYEKEQKPERRVAIAELIVASLDDLFSLTKPSQDILDPAGRILTTHPHIIEYWSCPDAHTDEEMFHITPWIRSL